MNDATASDENCFDLGKSECISGIFDEDSNTRLGFFDNSSESQNHEIAIKKQKDIEELESPEISDIDGAEQNNVDSQNKKCRKKRVLLKNEPIVLSCCWENCKYSLESVKMFLTHVNTHINQSTETATSKNSDQLTCQWGFCIYITSNSVEFIRHVNFHVFHTKLKSIGSNIKARSDLPDCLYGNNGNIFQIPDIEAHKCSWEDCTYESFCMQTFLFHVGAHVYNCDKVFKCLWKGCNNSFNDRNKLNSHVRVHTKEKVVACPDCGKMFATNTKFIDHCKRQLPLDLQVYQCAHCFKQYSSERILRDHMRSHINTFKCIYCDMTCANKHTLASHIRFRHLQLKPLKCPSCNYRCETKQDLTNHIRTHDEKDRFSCGEANCTFTCRTQRTIKKHYLKEHKGVTKIYECHICDRQYLRGEQLTIHLKSRHNLHWPSGHKRFSYRQDVHGKYKLQSIRYESLEVNEQIVPNKFNEEIIIIETDDQSILSNSETLKKINVQFGNENEFSRELIITYASQNSTQEISSEGDTSEIGLQNN